MRRLPLEQSVTIRPGVRLRHARTWSEYHGGIVIMRKIGMDRMIRVAALSVATAVILAWPAFGRVSGALESDGTVVAEQVRPTQLADDMGRMGQGHDHDGSGSMGGMGNKQPSDSGSSGAPAGGASPQQSPGMGDSKMEKHMKEMHRDMDHMHPPAGTGKPNPQGDAGGAADSDGDM